MSGWTRSVAGRVVIGIALAWSTACAVPGLAPESVPDDQRAAFESALRPTSADPASARAGLEAFLKKYPASPKADDAILRLAEIAFESGRQEEGVRWLGTILTQYPGSDREPSARLRLAELEYGRDRRVAARGLIAPVDFPRLSDEDQRAALRLRVSLSQTPVERMENLAQLQTSLREAAKRGYTAAGEPSPLETQLRGVDQEVDELIANAAPAELDSMLEALDRRPPAAAIAIELARRAVEGGEVTQAEERLARAKRLARGREQRATVKALEMRLAEGPANVAAAASLAPLRELSESARLDTRGAQGTLGVVLPLSGDFAEFGEASLRGILLATQVFEVGEGDGSASVRVETDRRDRANVRLVVRDSASDPAKTAAAVRELALMDDVVAIVGPIFSDEVVAAAEVAESEGVPLVTLSNREDVTAGRTFVMRTRTTPADEVNVLVNHAVDELAAKRFGVLYPRTRYGRGLRKLYWDAVVARGGKLVAMASYAPDETDFSNVIKEMVGFRFLSSGERQAIATRDLAVEAARSLPATQAATARRVAFESTGPGGEPLPPVVDFDVLFVPDSAEAVAMIAPGLALQGVSGVRLLGSSDWLDADLLRSSDRHVAGAIISTPFFAASDVGVVREFVDAYQRTFAAQPDAYAAQGYDAASLLMQQLATKRRDRTSLREGLLAVRGFPGASGSLTMLPDGNARRRPFLLEVSGQRFVPLD